ncbi:dTMP kinase [bacterium]|nr:dTMP kinase [bacterium]
MTKDIISLGGNTIGSQDKGGLFIVVEGLDGSGKTTQAELIADELKNRGKETVLTVEPTKTSPVAKRIKDALAKKYKIELEELQKLFSEDRKEHVEKVILPNLKEGKIIVSDRYAFTTFSYGSFGNNLEELFTLNENYPLPDLTIFIDVAPEECRKRIGGRGESNQLFDEIEKLKAHREGYKKIFKRFQNIETVDGNNTIEKTHKKAMQAVNAIL